MMMMDYGVFVRHLMQAPGLGKAGSALDRVATGGLLHYGQVPEDHLAASLDHAYRAFGGRVACFLVLTESGRYEAVAAFRGDAWGITLKRVPVVLHGDTIVAAKDGVRKPPLVLKPTASALFQVPCWITRQLLGLQGEAFYPLAAPADAVPPALGWDAGPWDRLRVLEACVRQRAEAACMAGLGMGAGAAAAGPVGTLHALGALYVGSIDDGQTEEMAALLKGIRVAKGPVWWVEDYTIFEPGCHTLVVRWLAGREVRYMTRRLRVAADGLRMVDLETGMASPRLRLVDEDGLDDGVNLDGGGLLRAFSYWVDSLLGTAGPVGPTGPPPSASSLPYLREEVLRAYGFLPLANVPTRPWLVQGKAMVPLPPMARLPPRLLYSPDLFLKRSRVSAGQHPTTVLIEITCQSTRDDPGLELSLKLGSRPDRGYRLLFRKGDGTVLPEADEIKVFTESQVPGKLVAGGISMCVLRHRARDTGATTVEFTLTMYGEEFTLYTNRRVVDLHLRAMVFEYRADVGARVHDGMQVPLFSKAVGGTAQRLGVPLTRATELAWHKLLGQGEGRVPVLWAARKDGGDYRFLHWDGEGMAVVS